MIKNLALAAAAVSSFAVLPAAAEAHGRNGYYSGPAYSQNYYGRSQYRNEYRPRCKSGTTGTIIGGAGGALLGREIAGRRNRTTGTILGAAIGALAGRELTRTKRRYC